ncbi:MAG: helix-turn-helix domain-containing protein [Planctomycetia bacterium]|nr:helix-turn-helix domain-containing protein [Planctomycetia bacterium]
MVRLGQLEEDKFQERLREYDTVVDLLLKGRHHKEIAQMLGVSLSLVRRINYGLLPRPNRSKVFEELEIVTKRCKTCGALITTEFCVACSLLSRTGGKRKRNGC